MAQGSRKINLAASWGNLDDVVVPVQSSLGRPMMLRLCCVKPSVVALPPSAQSVRKPTAYLSSISPFLLLVLFSLLSTLFPAPELFPLRRPFSDLHPSFQPCVTLCHQLDGSSSRLRQRLSRNVLQIAEYPRSSHSARLSPAVWKTGATFISKFFQSGGGRFQDPPDTQSAHTANIDRARSVHAQPIDPRSS